MVCSIHESTFRAKKIKFPGLILNKNEQRIYAEIVRIQHFKGYKVSYDTSQLVNSCECLYSIVLDIKDYSRWLFKKIYTLRYTLH